LDIERDTRIWVREINKDYPMVANVFEFKCLKENLERLGVVKNLASKI